MKKILYVNACVRPESRTDMLARHLLTKLDGEVEELKLGDEAIEPLNLQRLTERAKLIDEGDFSDDVFRYAKQFASADMVVIGAPYWDFSFPAMVKAYFEAITIQGLIFRYNEEGIPVGLTNVRRVIYVTTAGGPIGDMNMGFDYVNGICGRLYGIPDVKCYKAELLDVIGADVDGILAETMAEMDKAE